MQLSLHTGIRGQLKAAASVEQLNALNDEIVSLIQAGVLRGVPAHTLRRWRKATAETRQQILSRLAKRKAAA